MYNNYFSNFNPTRKYNIFTPQHLYPLRIRNIDLSEEQSELNNQLLHAAASGNNPLVKALLIRGADVDTKDELGFLAPVDTPLHLAALNGHNAVVTTLLAHQANINATNGSGRTPLHLAALKGHNAVVANLLAHRAKVNAKDNERRTPLHLAALYGQIGVIPILLSKGADYNARDIYGNTPWDLAPEALRQSIKPGTCVWCKSAKSML